MQTFQGGRTVRRTNRQKERSKTESPLTIITGGGHKNNTLICICICSLFPEVAFIDYFQKSHTIVWNFEKK